jgi:serine protease Do
MFTARARRLGALLACAMIVAACGGGGGATTTSPAGDTSTTTTPASTTTTVAGINSYDAVQPATIQIIAQGTFRDPEVGFSNGSGAGSGFIISPDGLAVTNNHVVAGAATLEVYVGGDTSKSYNATIVGVSECNDLALIDITESEPLPYLDWYNGEIKAGLQVYAAGYPLGDPEFTLTQGIVAKAKAGGDLTGTSSIDHTIEHDANIQPGNSGGPLVSADGKVVGVNYAGGAAVTTTAQFYAIASDLAQPVIEKLKTRDFESLGINGWAVYDDSAGIAGIWVAGVAAGSPASKADLLPGDIITSMNGLPVGTDGTFKDYCDVIRTAGTKPIAIEVLRYDTAEVLRGEINGDQPIELAFSFADQLQSEVDVNQGTTTYSSYQTITDDTGTLVMDVPVEWSDIATAPLDQDGVQIPVLSASTSQDDLYNTYDVPGVVLLKLPATNDIPTTLANAAPNTGECTDLGISDYSDPVFTGQYQVWDACGGTATALVVLAAVPQDSAYMAVMIVQVLTDADIEALDKMFATFNVVA